MSHIQKILKKKKDWKPREQVKKGCGNRWTAGSGAGGQETSRHGNGLLVPRRRSQSQHPWQRGEDVEVGHLSAERWWGTISLPGPPCFPPITSHPQRYPETGGPPTTGCWWEAGVLQGQLAPESTGRTPTQGTPPEKGSAGCARSWGQGHRRRSYFNSGQRCGRQSSTGAWREGWVSRSSREWERFGAATVGNMAGEESGKDDTDHHGEAKAPGGTVGGQLLAWNWGLLVSQRQGVEKTRDWMHWPRGLQGKSKSPSPGFRHLEKATESQSNSHASLYSSSVCSRSCQSNTVKTRSSCFRRKKYPFSSLHNLCTGFPGGASGKRPACQCWDRRDTDSVPGLGRSPEEGMATHSWILAWRILWTEERLSGYGPWGHKELDMIEVT